MPNHWTSFIANGGAGAYRSLLSIFNQTVLPDRIMIYCREEKKSSIDVVLATVIEDLGEKYRTIPTEFQTRNSGFLDIDIPKETISTLLVERDMYLPDYLNQTIKSKYATEKSTTNWSSLVFIASNYYQRKYLGNSKIINSAEVSLIPLSIISLLNPCKRVKRFTLDEKICQIEQPKNVYSSPFSEPLVIVQSNMNSALGSRKNTH